MKKTLFLLVHALFLTVIIWQLSGCALKRGTLTAEEAKYDRLYERAYHLMEKQKYEKAARLYTQAMTMTGDPYVAYGLAKAYARMDQEEPFWQAMAEAERRGYELAWQIEEEPAFRKYRHDPQYHKIIEEVEKNQMENCRDLHRSAALPPSETVLSFDSLDTLEKAFEEEEEKKMVDEWKLAYTEQQIRQQSRLARKIVALKRYIKNHPEANDLKEARFAEIETWKKLAGWSHWGKDIAEGMAEASKDFLAHYPEADEREELEFKLIEASLRGVLTGKEECQGEEVTIPLNCENTLPLMDQFIAGDDREDSWRTRAIGLKAYCLFEMSPDNPEEAMDVYEDFIERPEIANEEKKRIDWVLEIDLRRLKFLLNGAPDFTAETIEGRKISLSDLKGQVVLLDFWSPG